MATHQIRVISEEDWAILRKVVELNRNIVQNSTNRPNTQFLDGDDSMAPEVYIALPPSGGIPALDSITVGTSSDNPPAEGDRPGHAVCNIYQIVDGELKLISGITRTVYNLSESEIAQDWILIQRDKFGRWLPSQGGSGGTGVQTIRFRITDPANCELCTSIAEVISRPYGVSSVEEESGGLVTILDRAGCFLNEPIDSLVGRIGYASYLTSEEEGPCPGLPTTGWEIHSLCCAEEAC